MTRILKGEREGGFARLHKLPVIESDSGAGFGETTTYSRSLRGISRGEGSFAGVYDVTQEILKRNQRAFMNRYTLVRTFDDGHQATAVYENGKFVHPRLDLPSARRFNYGVAEIIRKGFDEAEEFYVTDPEIIAKMTPTERALRELYKGLPENDLDASVADSGSNYGIYGDSR